MNDLQNILLLAEEENFDRKALIPFSVLQAVVTKQAVSSLLKHTPINEYEHAEIIRIILYKGLRLFATLAIIRRPEVIQIFIEADHSIQPDLDSKLPFNDNDLRHVWDDAKIRDLFIRKQWMFLSPFIEADQAHRRLHDRAILPYRSKELIGSGGYAKVYKVKLIAGQHNLEDCGPNYELACKDLEDRLDAHYSFQNETHILSLLRCLRHPNIIKLVTAYTVHQPEQPIDRSTYSLLFPLAEGDLKKFLNDEKRAPGLRHEEEIVNALWGLASAIDAVHHYFADQFDLRKIGCHYDIKPKNILYRKGKLLLSDFGLSRLRNDQDDSRSQFQNVEGDYVAPECEDKELDHKKGAPGRKSDIWSFGCILSEMLASLCGGVMRVRQYRTDRHTTIGTERGSFFYSIGPAPNQGVIDLLQTPFGTETQRNLKVLVQDCLEIDPDRRPEAYLVASRLFHTSQKWVVDKILTSLERGRHEYDVEIELERFKIWMDVVGFQVETACGRVAESSWLFQAHSHQEYQDMMETLEELRKESAAIADIAQSSEKPAYRYCYHLQRLQDSLWGCQSRDICDQMERQLERTMVERFANVTSEAIDDTTVPCTDILHETSLNHQKDSVLGIYRRIKILGLAKRVSEALSSSFDSSNDMIMPMSQLQRPFEAFSHHYLSVHLPSGDSVLVETMTYSELWAARSPELVERVKSIASLRSRQVLGDFESMRGTIPILECKGYYHESSRRSFGLVYTLPPKMAGKDTKSLWNVIDQAARQKAVELRHPSTSTKFTLASRLVRAVANLHIAGWFHKNINSSNIIVCAEGEEYDMQTLDELYLIGFNYSRLNTETAFTQGPEDETKNYQHPKYIKAQKRGAKDPEQALKRFRPEYEWYSTGLVLLEIAVWRPLDMMIKDWKNYDPAQVTKAIIKHHVPMARTYMGDCYGQAVVKCLSTYSGGRASNEAELDFEQEVLQPITQRKV